MRDYDWSSSGQVASPEPISLCVVKSPDTLVVAGQVAGSLRMGVAWEGVGREVVGTPAVLVLGGSGQGGCGQLDRTGSLF